MSLSTFAQGIRNVGESSTGTKPLSFHVVSISTGTTTAGTDAFQWSTSETLALAKPGCSTCAGSGLTIALRTSKLGPCNCVLREIFKICYAKFKECATQDRHISTVSMEPGFGRQRPLTFGRKCEEYMADFCSVSRRALKEDEHALFRLYFLLGADWRLVSHRMKISRGDFFHMVNRIEARLGRVYAELQPYALYPLDEYFGGSRKGVAVNPLTKIHRRQERRENSVVSGRAHNGSRTTSARPSGESRGDTDAPTGCTVSNESIAAALITSHTD